MMWHIVFFIIRIRSILAKELVCKFTSDEVSLSTDLEITCNLFNSTSCLMQTGDRIWIQGSSKTKTVIYMNGYPRDQSGKFWEKNVTCNESSLVVTNFTETDLNKTYALSVNLHEDEITATPEAINFKYLPQEHEIEKNLTTASDAIRLHLEIQKAYPTPRCTCFRENIFVPWNKITTLLFGWFYSATYELLMDTVNDDRPTTFLVICNYGKQSILILNETIERSTDESLDDAIVSFHTSDILFVIFPFVYVSAVSWSAYRNRAGLLELYKELPKRTILEWRRPFIASILSIVCVVVSFVYGLPTVIEMMTTLISNSIISYSRSVGVSIMIILGVVTLFNLCFLSNPKTISIREGIRNAGKNGHERIEELKKVILCQRKVSYHPGYRDVSQEDHGNVT